MKIKMISQKIILLLAFSLISSCAINDKQQINNLIESITARPLTTQDIAAGLKEALRVGSERVVVQVGKTDGYLKDKIIHIFLPPELQKIHNTLNKVGLGQYTNELEMKMNRAAEIAAPKAKQLFWTAIQQMQWSDVQVIYKGKDDAATEYFRNKMTPSLRTMMRPVIKQTLSEAGAVQAFNHVVKQYHSIPFVPRVEYDMEGYVMDYAIQGMFYYLAKEEAAIRKDPVKRTTAILKKVFGN